MADLFARKPLNRLMGEAQEVGEHTLKRSLGPTNLVMLGIGAIIGAGLFVRTAAAIADRAGPSVVLAFVVAGVGCAFAGLCYAEFASMIPVAGSAYTYSYATMGEFVAWIIGWDLILEYAVGAATVSIARNSPRLRRNSRHTRRRRGCVLCVHRVRCGVDRGAGSAQSQAGYADWYSRLIGHLHHFICAVFLRAQRCRHSPGFSDRRA